MIESQNFTELHWVYKYPNCISNKEKVRQRHQIIEPSSSSLLLQVVYDKR